MIKPGEILQGRYRVINQLGVGGFGQTFELDDGGTRKVLKVLKLSGFNDPEYKQKIVSLFEQEAKVLKHLHHRGVPKVEADGYFTFRPLGSLKPLHCLVMEKIDGQNLEEWHNERGNQPISQQQAIDWLKQLVEILEQVHDQEYFHRDIKPSNIMLKPEGQLVLIDFGGVRQITATYLVQIGIRRKGTQIISPGYTPPEQYEGRAVPQSDFFALGSTFVQLLTGKHPLEFPKNPETGELSWRDCATQVSKPLADLIDYLIAPFPGQRPQNTQVILERLAGAPVAGAISLPANNPLTVVASPTEVVVTNRPKIKSSKERLFKLIGANFRLVASLLLLGFIIFPFLLPQIARYFNQIGYNNSNDAIAEFYFRLALLFNPNFGMAHYNLGSACEEQKKFNCAYSEYQTAIQSNDNRAVSYASNNLAFMYIERYQKYDDAITLISQALKRAEEVAVKADLQRNMGLAYLKKNNNLEAKTHLQESINLQSDRTDAHCLLAATLEKLNDKQGAIVASEKCLNNADENNPEHKKWIDLARQRLATAMKNPG